MSDTPVQRLIVDGRPVAFAPGEKVLTTLLKANLHPTGGGCLCCAGDCPHCIATVDGVSYVRTCQVATKPGMLVERHHQNGQYPPLLTENQPHIKTKTRNLHCDVVVIGAGESGSAEKAKLEAAGKSVLIFDSKHGQDVVGIYAGPMVVVHAGNEILQVHVHEEVVVATGSAEIQPVADGNMLAGLVTARAATELASAGVRLGRVVAVGSPPENVEHTHLTGDLICFEGDGTVSAVIMADADGNETRTECDTVSLGLGFHPRDALRRQGHDMAVRAVGDAATESDIPPCPKSGMLCPCSGVTVNDMEFIWDQGFEELELVKRATLAGTGTCQGSVCIPWMRSFLAEKGKVLQPAFTARPVTKQLTIGEIGADNHLHPIARTPLDAEHRRLGAKMEISGGWWRPWHYGNPLEEYWAVREGVSIMDVSTLGKMQVKGPDALEFLEKIYPTNISTIRTGRSRYVLVLDERGYVLDDGLVCKEADNHYTLTFTSSGSTFAEAWLRDWANGFKMDVRIINQTWSVGAINVTGPLSRQLLKRAGLETPPRYMRHTNATVADVECKVFRLSFTGELSFELHHNANNSVTLWRALLELGQELGVKPHGLDILRTLRLEKGHIIVGQDSDFDSTPRRLHHEWMVKMDKEFFIGRTSLQRTNKIPLDKMLVGLEMDGPAPTEGATMWVGDNYVGYLTSSGDSLVLGKAVMLGWLYYVDGTLPTEVTIEGRPARLAELPFYDKEAARARA